MDVLQQQQNNPNLAAVSSNGPGSGSGAVVEMPRGISEVTHYQIIRPPTPADGGIGRSIWLLYHAPNAISMRDIQSSKALDTELIYLPPVQVDKTTFESWNEKIFRVGKDGDGQLSFLPSVARRVASTSIPTHVQSLEFSQADSPTDRIWLVYSSIPELRHTSWVVAVLPEKIPDEIAEERIPVLLGEREYPVDRLYAMVERARARSLSGGAGTGVLVDLLETPVETKYLETLSKFPALRISQSAFLGWLNFVEIFHSHLG